MKAPRIDLNIWPEQDQAAHGTHDKDLFVFHETVSPDVVGLSDVKGISHYLAVTDHDGVKYGIHGVLDREGNFGWVTGHANAIFYHASSSGSRGSGDVNTRGIGLELISDIPLVSSNPLRIKDWAARKKQLYRSARILEWQSHVHRFPLRYSDGDHPGVTTHWQVTMTFGVPGGHTDCWPKHKGGYFPVLSIIAQARAIRKLRLG